MDYRRYQDAYGAVVIDADLDGTALAATTPTGGSVKSSLYTIFVQKVVISHLTHVDGKVLTVQDDNGTPSKIVDYVDDAENDTTANADCRTFDFGPAGIPLTQGKNLQLVANTGGTGFTGRVHIEGYQKLTGVGAA